MQWEAGRVAERFEQHLQSSRVVWPSRSPGLIPVTHQPINRQTQPSPADSILLWHSPVARNNLRGRIKGAIIRSGDRHECRRRANIVDLSHCATRLRFQLRDASGVKQSDIEAVPGVMGAVPQAGNRYQVVIGGAVQSVYNDIKALPGMGGVAADDAAGEGRRPGQGSCGKVRLA